MSIYSKLNAAKKKISGSSLTQLVGTVNSNVTNLADANLQLLDNINYSETLNSMQFFKATLDEIDILEQLSLVQNGVTNLTIDNSGRIDAKDILTVVSETKRQRFTDFPDYPEVGVPGEIIYTGIMSGVPESELFNQLFGEDLIAYFDDRGWVSLTDGSGGGGGNPIEIQWDEDVITQNVSSINFTGEGVASITNIGNDVTINLQGGGGPSVTVEANTGLDLTGNVLSTTFNSTLSPTLALPAAFRGIAQGTTVQDLTQYSLLEILEKIIFPQVPPTYTSPSTVINVTPTGLLEIGLPHTVTGSVSFIQNDAGAATTYRIKKGTSTISTSTTFSETFTDTTPTLRSYTSEVDYAQGPLKNDNFGQPYPTGRINAGTVTSTPKTVKTIFPYFYGVTQSSTTTLTAADVIGGTPVLAESDVSISITFGSTSSQKSWFAIPASEGSQTTKDDEYTSYFVTSLNQGQIGGTNVWQSPYSIVVTVNSISHEYWIYQTAYGTAFVNANGQNIPVTFS